MWIFLGIRPFWNSGSHAPIAWTKEPVHVYKLVSEGTIEERLLETLASKQDLADAALDIDSEVCSVEMKSSIERIRDRLEKILVPAIAAPVDESMRQRLNRVSNHCRRRERVSQASGQLLGAALKLVGELVATEQAPEPDHAIVSGLAKSLSECVERDETGRPQLRISLDSDDALRDLAVTLARLLSAKS